MDIWDSYECEGQIELEDYLWDLYFATCMNPPVEEVEDEKVIAKGSEEFQLFNDFWKFRQDYHDPEESDAFWEEVTEAGRKLVEKYKGQDCHNFAQELVFSCIADLEKRVKK